MLLKAKLDFSGVHLFLTVYGNCNSAYLILLKVWAGVP